MLPKKRRLTRKHHTLAHTPKRCNATPHLSVRVLSLGGQREVSRFSFVVSKKIAKTAVQRNALRRIGYDLVGEINRAPLCGKGFIFYFRKGAETCSRKQIKDEILSLLNQIDV